MDCPRCGYVLSPFDVDCPRCQKMPQQDGQPPPDRSHTAARPAVTQAVARAEPPLGLARLGIAIGTTFTGYLVGQAFGNFLKLPLGGG